MSREILEFNDARLVVKNFSGKPSQYNREGDRNFGLVLDNEEQALQMITDGWNVKIRAPRVDGEETFFWVPIKVKYNSIGPKAYLVIRNKMTELNEDTIGRLDKVAIESVALDIAPSNWSVNGKSGITAYLQAIKVVQKCNRFEQPMEEVDNNLN